jgi:hypothetical protein
MFGASADPAPQPRDVMSTRSGKRVTGSLVPTAISNSNLQYWDRTRSGKTRAAARKKEKMPAHLGDGRPFTARSGKNGGFTLLPGAPDESRRVISSRAVRISYSSQRSDVLLSASTRSSLLSWSRSWRRISVSVNFFLEADISVS